MASSVKSPRECGSHAGEDNVSFESIDDVRLEFAEALQSSLELRETISQFYALSKQHIASASLNYVNTSKEINLQFGTPRQYQAKYNLKFKNRNLGVLCFTRSSAFSEQELRQIEDMIALLYYPLRNALLYLDALDNSLRDALTKVGNRAAMELALKRELCLTKRHNKPLSLLVVDVDHFKKINDSIGHHNGDRVLKHIASLIQETLRQTDQIFRFGGEEFVVLLSDTDLQAAMMVAERIRIAVEFSFIKIPEHGTVQATVSLGASSFSGEDSRESLFARADEALYKAKSTGRNRVVNENEIELPGDIASPQAVAS